MNIHVKTYLAIGFALIVSSRCAADYPTLDLAKSLFSSNRLDDSSLDFWQTAAYEDFLLNLEGVNDDMVKSVGKIAMKDFFLSTMTSIVVRVSTNAVDDGASPIPYRQDRYLAFTRAFWSFGDAFRTNVADCLSIASYLGRVRTVSYPEELVHIMASVYCVTKDEEKRKEWQRKRDEWFLKRERQCRVWRANDRVKKYRRALFDICNACVLANRRVMDDEAFAAFTNRVVELSKPDETESKFHLFNHLDEMKRRSP